MSRGDVDREIDRAVREMLDVDAPASIRARVVARIGAGVAPKPWSGEGGRRWEWIAAPIVAAALLVLAMILRPAPGPVVSVPIVARIEPPAVSRVAKLPPKGGSFASRRTVARVGRSPERLEWLPATAGSSTIATAPLTALAPISVQPVQPRALDHPEVAIDALPDITPISIEALPPGRH
jgi:hypothetical protein